MADGKSRVVQMERVMGFEPTASTLARLRSSQLSYTRIGKQHSIKKDIMAIIPNHKNLGMRFEPRAALRKLVL